MKSTLFVKFTLALMIVGSTAVAQHLQPVPDTVPGQSLSVPAVPAPETSGSVMQSPYTPAPAPSMSHPSVDVPVIHYDVAPAPLYTNVRYVDKHEVHPQAITKIIRVNRPRKSPVCDPCDEDCVFIQICIPPCGCETVKCRRHGDRLRYDYGKYKVDVRIRRHNIVVDYQS